MILLGKEKAGRWVNFERESWVSFELDLTAKTRGFNIEDTHITDFAKLSTLLGIVTLAVTWHTAARPG